MSTTLSTPSDVAFVLPRLDRPSGGNTFNARVLQHWPDRPPERELASTAAELAAAVRRHRVCVVDGLLATTWPQEFAAAVHDGHRLVLLLHMTQGEDASWRDEHTAVRAASALVVPSRHTAGILARRYGRHDAVVAVPGARTAVLSDQHEPPTVLQVGALGPLKNQLLTVQALLSCADLDVRLHLVGPVVDDAYAQRVLEQATELGPGRVRIDGPLSGEALAMAYAGADVLVSVATNEAYGLVVTEALSHGIPALVGRGTGAVEALHAGGGLPGARVSTNDPAELATTLRRWATDPGLRSRWRRDARAAATNLPSWSSTARRLADLCRTL